MNDCELSGVATAKVIDAEYNWAFKTLNYLWSNVIQI